MAVTVENGIIAQPSLLTRTDCDGWWLHGSERTKQSAGTDSVVCVASASVG